MLTAAPAPMARKPVTVGSNPFACQAAPCFTVCLQRTELCIDSSSGSPAVEQCHAPGFSDAMRHQPVRFVEVLSFRVKVNDTTQSGGPSSLCCVLTHHRHREVTVVVSPSVLAPHPQESSPASLLVATPPSQPASPT